MSKRTADNLKGMNMSAVVIDDLLQRIQTHGAEASFVANLIMTRHRKVATKLRGLFKLLKDGHTVRTAQFSGDTLVIDGFQAAWTVLDQGDQATFTNGDGQYVNGKFAR